MPVLAKNFLMLDDAHECAALELERGTLSFGGGCFAPRRSFAGSAQVHGESMLPALWPGDVVEIESCSLEDIRPGEIVLAQRDGRLFLHRFVAALHAERLCAARRFHA